MLGFTRLESEKLNASAISVLLLGKQTHVFKDACLDGTKQLNIPVCPLGKLLT